MNKSELVDAIAKSADFTKVDAAKALDAIISSITASVKKGNKVTIPGFISFEKVKRAARDGRNPSTGATIKIKAKNVVKLKAGKTLQDAMN